MWEIALPIIQTIGIGVVMPAVATWLGLHVRNQMMRQALIGATERAGGIAYDYLANRSQGMSNADARKEAFGAAIAYAEKAAAAPISTLGVSGDVIENMVRGQLGKLLASDPVVTVADKLDTAPPATTTTIIGEKV